MAEGDTPAEGAGGEDGGLSWVEFDSSFDLTARLNALIAPCDVVVYHNFHGRHKLQVRDKLVCDLFDFAAANLKGKDFSVAELAAQHGVAAGEEAVVIMQIFDRMNALQLGNELSEISGCPLNRCLENARLERNEYMLLHELYARGYLFPPETQRRAARFTGGLVLDPVRGFYDNIVLLLDFNSLYASIIQEYDVCFSTVGIEEEEEDYVEGKDDNVNESIIEKDDSVNGSIIERDDSINENINNNTNEKDDNINNTINTDIINTNTINTKNNESTIEMQDMINGIPKKIKEENIKRLCVAEDPQTIIFLPRILKGLVDRRKAVKALIAQAEAEDERKLLDVRQKAIKLCANSIYGCLGSPASRFCNYRMASYITAKGRELLRAARAEAERLSLEVIYGDTDSIMVKTRFPGDREYLSDALQIAEELAANINRHFRCIEIETEGAFKKLLLLAKKKYATLIFTGDGTRIESKGLDMHRRDFCKASTELARQVLEIIMTDSPSSAEHSKAELVYAACQQVAASLQSRPVADFSILSSFSKDPLLYQKNVGLPHVSLALRLQKERGIVYRQDDVIHYVIGEGQGQISSRAFHPHENFKVDFSYYINSQILPPLFRLLSASPDISTGQIASIFGVSHDTARPVERKGIRLVMPCCGSLQEPAALCSGCSRPVQDSFYIEHTAKLLADHCRALYGSPGHCPHCKIDYLNYAIRCLRCANPLVFESRNSCFDSFLSNLEASFAPLGISQVTALAQLYSRISAHRIVDLSVYYPKEIARYAQLSKRH